VRLKANWADLIWRTHHGTASDCQGPSGQIPEDEPEQGIDGYEGKDFEKKRVLRWELKRPWNLLTTGPRSHLWCAISQSFMRKTYWYVCQVIRARVV